MKPETLGALTAICVGMDLRDRPEAVSDDDWASINRQAIEHAYPLVREKGAIAFAGAIYTKRRDLLKAR